MKECIISSSVLVLSPFEQGKTVCALTKMENVFRQKPSLEIFNLLCCYELQAIEKEFVVEI